MQINWIELRNKKTGLTLKKVTLSKHVAISGENTEAIRFLLDAITGAAAFAGGEDHPYFRDVICRINFNANHQEYLWYAKNTSGENAQIIVDEEELYDQHNQMLLRRSFQEMTYAGFAQLPLINLSKSMLYLFNPNPLIAEISAAFSHIYRYTPTPDDTATLLDALQKLPHGMAIIIDASSLGVPLDLTALASNRSDLQLITVNCILDSATPMLVTQNGKMIGCK